MLVSITLTAVTVGYAWRAPAQNVSTRSNGPRPKRRPTGPRPRHIALRPRRDPRRIGPRPRRDVSTSWDRLETETSRPRPHPWCLRYAKAVIDWSPTFQPIFYQCSMVGWEGLSKTCFKLRRNRTNKTLSNSNTGLSRNPKPIPNLIHNRSGLSE